MNITQIVELCATHEKIILELVKASLDTRAHIGDTGGGCTAIFVPVGRVTDEMRGAWPTYWMITQDVSAPCQLEAPTQVGFYHWPTDNRDGADVDRWICFNVPNVLRAIELIKSFAGHQL